MWVTLNYRINGNTNLWRTLWELCWASGMSFSVAHFIDEVSENAIHLLCVMSKEQGFCASFFHPQTKALGAPTPSLLQLWWKPGWSAERRRQSVLAPLQHVNVKMLDYYFFQNWWIKYGLILGFHVNICFVFFKTWSVFLTFLHTRTRKWRRGCISLWSRSSLIFYSPVPPPFTDALSLPSLALEPDGLPHQSKFLESHLVHVCVCACLCVRVHAHVSQHYSVFILRKRERKKIFKEIFCLIHFICLYTGSSSFSSCMKACLSWQNDTIKIMWVLLFVGGTRAFNLTSVRRIPKLSSEIWPDFCKQPEKTRLCSIIWMYF